MLFSRIQNTVLCPSVVGLALACSSPKTDQANPALSGGSPSGGSASVEGSTATGSSETTQGSGTTDGLTTTDGVVTTSGVATTVGAGTTGAGGTVSAVATTGDGGTSAGAATTGDSTSVGGMGTTGGMATTQGSVSSGGSPSTGGSSGTGGSGAAGGSGGDATGGAGGSGGTGGLPTVPDNGCNVRLTDTPIGFAAEGGGTNGGGDATPILVTTGAELKSYLEDAEARVLYVMNDLDLRTDPRDGVAVCADDTPCDNGYGEMIDEPRVSSTCDAGEHAATSYRYETRIDVASNKTIIGIGDGGGAAIYGASFNVGSSSQVIFRNLEIRDVNPHLVEAGDGITLQGSRHIWIDHVLFADISDGLVDIGSSDHSTTDDYITLSWVHFDGHTPYQCGGQHSFVNFVDNGRITYHHDFYDNASGRNPKISGSSSEVHLFNNYWLNISYFCITAQVDAQARVESNYFENSSRPHWLQLDGNGTAGIAIDDGNVYTGASAGNTNRDTGGSVFSVPYTYTKESAETAKQDVLDCAGPQPIR